MDFLKWANLICTSLLAMVAIFLAIRDYKFWDRRTRWYHRISKLSLAIALVATLGLVMVQYRELSKREKSPLLSVNVNGTSLERTNRVVVGVTNNTAAIQIYVDNNGDLPADGCVVIFAASHFVPVAAGDGWHKSKGSVDTTIQPDGTSLKIVGDQVYFASREIILTTRDILPLPPLFIQNLTNGTSIITGLKLVLSTKNTEDREYVFDIIARQ